MDQPGPTVRDRIRERLADVPLALVVVAGTAVVLGALGLWTISRRPFWLDEASSILFARNSLDVLLDNTARNEPNMAFYYLVLHFWRELGESELRLRLFAVLCAVATVPALYVLGRKLLGQRAALFGVAVFATNAFVVEYSQQVRGYTLLILLLVLATLVYLEARERHSTLLWLGYGLLIAAALWTHFFAGFVFVAHLLGLAWRPWPPWPRLRPALPGFALVLAAAAPIAYFIAFRHTTQIVWVAPTTPDAVWAAAVDVAGGDELRLGIVVALTLFGLIGARRSSAGLLIMWVVVPFAGAILVSIVQPVFVARYLLLATPALALLAGAGLARLRLPAGAAMVVVLAVAAVPSLAAYYDGPYDDWRGAAAYVATYAQAGDQIVFKEPSAAKPFGIYFGRHRVPPMETISGDEPTSAARVWLIFWRLGHADATAFRNALGRYQATVNDGYGGVRVQLAVPR